MGREGFGRKEPEQRVEDEPRTSPLPSPCSCGTREPGPGPHPRAGAPPCGRAAAPAVPRSPAESSPRGPRNKTRRKFPTQAVRERSKPGPGASKRGRGGAAPSLAAMARGPSPNGPPEGSEVPRSGARALQIPRAKGFSLPQPSSEGREGNLGPRQVGMPPQLPGHAWGSWVCFIHFLNWREGATKSLWRILIPSNLDSGCPPPKPTCSPPPHPTPPSLLG